MSPTPQQPAHHPLRDLRLPGPTLVLVDDSDALALEALQGIEDVPGIEPTVVPPNVASLASRLGLTLATCDRLLELSRGLAVNVDTKVKAVQNLNSGEASILFDETHRGDGGAPLKVPNGFVISIPIFRSGATYALPVRLRYRVKPDGIVWTVVIARADDAFRNAFMESCVHAQEGTGLPLFYGSPEK